MTKIKTWIVVGDDYLIHREMSNTRKKARAIMAQAPDQERIRHRVQRAVLSWDDRKKKNK